VLEILDKILICAVIGFYKKNNTDSVLFLTINKQVRQTLDSGPKYILAV